MRAGLGVEDGCERLVWIEEEREEAAANAIFEKQRDRVDF